MLSNRFFLLLSLLWCISHISYAQPSSSIKVLFIGNSYTGNNDLPSITKNVALSVGDTLTTDKHTPGGERLLDHAANATAMTKIFSANWDHVVLQAQSQEPSWSDGQVAQEVFPYAKQLCDSIRANDPCTRPVFYMTWGRENGDASNCGVLPWVCTYEGMDSVLNQNYQIMGADNDAYVSPVGAVWHYLRDNHPNVDLYAADESHPSPAGSYAGACTFYTIFFRKDPTLITYNYTVDSTTAATIRNAVKTIVYDDLLQWNVGEFDPLATFTYTDTAMTFDFTNTSTQANSYYWNFGDGQTDTAKNTTHIYSTPGTYEVVLVAIAACGMSDTAKSTITINPVSTGIADHIAPNVDFRIYPNPMQDQAIISFGEPIKDALYIELYNVQGELVQTYLAQGEKEVQLSTSSLQKGMYLVHLRSAYQILGFRKLLIQK